MTKSASATLVGILVGQGALDIHQPTPVRGWSELESFPATRGNVPQGILS